MATRRKTCRLSPENAAAVALTVIAFVMLFNLFTRCAKGGEVGPADASVKVRCKVGNGWATGSGTAIDSKYVITCEHVTNSTPENTQGGFEIFDYHRNTWLRAELAAATPGDGVDISVLYVPDGNLNYASLGDDAVIQDSSFRYGIEGYGFAGTDTLYSRKGTLVDERAAKIDIRYGDSGGGLFSNNKLIGVIWGSANPEGGVNIQMQAPGQPSEIRLYTNNVCQFTPLRTIGRALRNWCQTGRLRPSRPYFGLKIYESQDKVQNGRGPYCPGGNCPQGTPGYGGGFDGGNISPNGNNPYFPYPENDLEQDNENGNSNPNGQPPIAGDPIKPKPTIPENKVPQTKPEDDKYAKLEQKLKELEEKQKKCEETETKLVETQAALEAEKNKPKPEMTLPKGKIRIKVNPKTGKVAA